MSDKFKKLSYNIYFNIVILVVISAVYTAICLYFGAATIPYYENAFVGYFRHPLVFFVNFLPVVCICMLGFFVSNRVWIGAASGGFIPLIFTLINYFKMKYRNEVFAMADISLIGEAANMGERYSFLPDNTMWLCFAFIIATVIMCAKICKFTFRTKTTNIVCAIILVLTVVFCFEPVYLGNSIYAKTEYTNAKNPNTQYMCRGFIYSFLHSGTSLYQKPPENYDEQQAKEILNSYKADKIPDDKKVNMICIMLEAYNDFSKFDNVKFKNNPYTDYLNIKEKSIHGQLFTNVFGGGTIATERAFITGFSHIYNSGNPIDTYAKYMRDNGYTVEGGHPGHSWFYSREKVNADFGFENYYFLENRYQKIYDSTVHTGQDNILEDQYLFDDIIALYEQNKQSGKPYFNFSVTHQNHGPYQDRKFIANKVYIEKTEQMSLKTYNIVNNYFSGIEKTNQQIGKLVNWADDQKEPLMLVLFGDHNPWLYNGYSELGININTETTDGFYNHYQTPYIIYANNAAKEMLDTDCTGYGGDFSPMFLMNKVFKTNGWGGSRFMKISNELNKYIDIVSHTGFVRQNGEFTKQPDKNATEALNKLGYVEYYMQKNTN